MNTNTLFIKKARFQVLTFPLLDKFYRVIQKGTPRASNLPSSLYIWDLSKKTSLYRANRKIYLIKRSAWVALDKEVVSSTPIRSVKEFVHLQDCCRNLNIREVEEVDISPEVLKALPDDYARLVSFDRDQSEYVYEIKNLAELPGKDYSDFRYKVNKFKSLYGEKVEFIVDGLPESKELLEHVYDLYEIWNDFETQGSKHDPRYERTALERYMNLAHFAKSPSFAHKTECYYLWVDNKLVGFSLVEIVSNTYAVGHFLKLNLNLSGVSEYFINLIAEDLCKRSIVLLNTQEDMGIQGLRKFKNHLRPKFLLQACTVTFW